MPVVRVQTSAVALWWVVPGEPIKGGGDGRDGGNTFVGMGIGFSTPIG